jgi:hypothetical protein
MSSDEPAKHAAAEREAVLQAVRQRRKAIGVKKVTPAERAAVAQAIGTWKPPRVASTQLFTTAASARSPILEAGLIDATRTTLLADALRDADAVRRATIPQVVGSSLITEMTRGAAPPAAAGVLGVINANRGLSEGLLSVTKNLTTVMQAIREPMLKARQLAEQTNALFVGWQPQFERFAETMRQFAEEGRELDEQTDRFIRKHGWPVPTFLSLRTYRAIVSRHGAGKRDVTRFMVESFRPGRRAYSMAREALDGSPNFASRRPLLRQVYRAQRRGDWYLVINGLLPLVEGVLLDAIYPSGTRPKALKKGSVEKLKEGTERVYAEDAFDALELMVLGGGGGMALFESYAPPRGVEPRRLNRHGILHGIARRYGTEENATRMFLLMVMLVECLAIYEDPSKKRSGADGSS